MAKQALVSKRPARSSGKRAAATATPDPDENGGVRPVGRANRRGDDKSDAGAAAPSPSPPEPVPASEEQALEQVENGEAVGIPTLGGLAGGLRAVLGQRRALARETLGLGREALRIARGTSSLAPPQGDRRFADPAWSANPFYRRLAQSYLALGDAAQRLVDELETGDVDWHQVERARFAVNVLVSAAAPTNTLIGNPAALKRTFETGGRSFVRGLGHMWDDLRHNGGMPSQTDRSAFVVGRDLALTPGAVIDRDEVAEVLQYRPSTSTVRSRPVLIVPPPIGRYYFLDLRPGRSFVEYALSEGLQVFMVSWRNPQPEQSHWDLDTYAERIVSAIDTVREITGSDDVHTLGFCAGGILTATVLNHLAAHDDARVHSASYAVTLLDFGTRAAIGTFSSPRLLELAGSRSRKKGIITAQAMGTVFSWMRPDDLVFNYWVNNYLMGEDPPVFDILAWNADGTNLPGSLHDQFLDIFKENTLVEPGTLEVLETPVELNQIEVPTFVTGAVTDHLTPWKGCYRTTQLLSGESTFVLSNAGHIASLVNPPGNPKASYHAGGPPGPDPDAWLAGAERKTGSWWEAWAQWLLPRAGDERPAPERLGSDAHPPSDEAPGRYVRDLTP